MAACAAYNGNMPAHIASGNSRGFGASPLRSSERTSYAAMNSSPINPCSSCSRVRQDHHRWRM